MICIWLCLFSLFFFVVDLFVKMLGTCFGLFCFICGFNVELPNSNCCELRVSVAALLLLPSSLSMCCCCCCCIYILLLFFLYFFGASDRLELTLRSIVAFVVLQMACKYLITKHAYGKRRRSGVQCLLQTWRPRQPVARPSERAPARAYKRARALFAKRSPSTGPTCLLCVALWLN